MSYNNELYGGFGYKDYYDMVEKSAKKLSDNGKQKIYSASTHRKICEAQQKKILNTLIGKKTTDTQFTKEDIKLAKTDVTKIKDTSKQSTDIDAVKLEIRKKLSNAGNTAESQLKFLDCTSGKLLKYLIRIELRNYKKCLIDQKKYEKKQKKSSKKVSETKSDEKPKNCSKENFLKIVKKIVKKEPNGTTSINFSLNTVHILELINKLLTTLKNIKEKLEEIEKPMLADIAEKIKIKAREDSRNRKKTTISFDIPKISKNEMAQIVSESLGISSPNIMSEEYKKFESSIKLGDENQGKGQNGGFFSECYSASRWFLFWGIITFIIGGFTLIMIGTMMAMSCGFVNLFFQDYNKKNNDTYNKLYNEGYNEGYSRGNNNTPQKRQQTYQQTYEYRGPNLKKSSTDLARGFFIATDKLSDNIVRSFIPTPRTNNNRMRGGVDKNNKSKENSADNKKIISIGPFIEQIKITIGIFTKFKEDIKKINDDQNNPTDIDSTKICAYNSDDTCFESRKNLNHIKKMLKYLDAVFDYGDTVQTNEEKQLGMQPEPDEAK